jgi:hypothetical protein
MDRIRKNLDYSIKYPRIVKDLGVVGSVNIVWCDAMMWGSLSRPTAPRRTMRLFTMYVKGKKFQSIKCSAFDEFGQRLVISRLN